LQEANNQEQIWKISTVTGLTLCPEVINVWFFDNENSKSFIAGLNNHRVGDYILMFFSLLYFNSNNLFGILTDNSSMEIGVILMQEIDNSTTLKTLEFQIRHDEYVELSLKAISKIFLVYIITGLILYDCHQNNILVLNESREVILIDFGQVKNALTGKNFSEYENPQDYATDLETITTLYKSLLFSDFPLSEQLTPSPQKLKRQGSDEEEYKINFVDFFYQGIIKTQLDDLWISGLFPSGNHKIYFAKIFDYLQHYSPKNIEEFNEIKETIKVQKFHKTYFIYPSSPSSGCSVMGGKKPRKKSRHKKHLIYRRPHTKRAMNKHA